MMSKTPPYYQLSEKHLKNVTVVPTRTDILKKLPKNSIVAEIGVAKGRFSKKILEFCNPKELNLIDSWISDDFNDDAHEHVKDIFKLEIKNKTVKIHKGDSSDILKTFSENYFDWVYIDTDHTYSTTKKELKNCKNVVKESGIIAGHDYTNRNYRDGSSYGVAEAVNEFCYKHEWEFIYLSHETHRHISFAIKRIF